MSEIDLLVCAIGTAEGAFHPSGVTVPQRLRNPGDLMFAGQEGAKRHPVLASDGKTRVFAEFRTLELGIAALYRQVLKRVAEGYTLRRLICDPVSGWAPASDGNNSENYLRETVRRTGIDPDRPLWDYLIEEFHQIP